MKGKNVLENRPLKMTISRTKHSHIPKLPFPCCCSHDSIVTCKKLTELSSQKNASLSHLDQKKLQKTTRKKASLSHLHAPIPMLTSSCSRSQAPDYMLPFSHVKNWTHINMQVMGDGKKKTRNKLPHCPILMLPSPCRQKTTRKKFHTVPSPSKNFRQNTTRKKCLTVPSE